MNKTHRFVELAKIKRLDPLCIYDIGSFDASQALELAIAFPKAKIVALEADPYNMPKCLATAKGHPRIHVVNAALGPMVNPGITRFHRSVGNNDQCGSLLMPKDPVEMPMEAIEVACVSSNQLAFYYGAPELLWMDVQGTEWEFFDGTCIRPKLVWMEVAYSPYYYGQPDHVESTRLMKSIGYDVLHQEVGVAGRWGDICYEYVR